MTIFGEDCTGNEIIGHRPALSLSQRILYILLRIWEMNEVSPPTLSETQKMFDTVR